MTPEQEELLRLQRADYSHLQLSLETYVSARRVRTAAESICGVNWNHYSNALRREVVYVFQQAITDLLARFPTVDYLEIGSAYGISLSMIALLLKDIGALGELVSVDPYIPYTEGAMGIWGQDVRIEMGESVLNGAVSLYSYLGLDVELIRAGSTQALRQLTGDGRLFHLVYLDGRHEGFMPMRDFALSLEVLRPGGALMLDEHLWPDVRPVRELCDRHAVRVAECWKTIAYRILG